MVGDGALDIPKKQTHTANKTTGDSRIARFLFTTKLPSIGLRWTGVLFLLLFIMQKG